MSWLQELVDIITNFSLRGQRWFFFLFRNVNGMPPIHQYILDIIASLLIVKIRGYGFSFFGL